MKTIHFSFLKLALSLFFLCFGTMAEASPYASCVTNNAGAVTFYLNEGGGNVVITYEDGSTNRNFNGITSGTNLPAGSNSFTLGSHTSYAITVSKLGSGTMGVITNVAYGTPRGVDVNKNPHSPFFGQVYLAFGGTGIYTHNSDLSLKYGGVKTGSVNWIQTSSQSPNRIAVAPDDYVMVTDSSTSASAVWRIDPSVTTNQLFLGPVGEAAGLAIGSHGTICSCLLQGELAASNATLLTVDGDLLPLNSLQIYKIGNGPLPWSGLPITGPQIGITNWTYEALNGNEYPGITVGPNGYIYISTFRDDLDATKPDMQIYDATGRNPLWNSWYNLNTEDYFVNIVPGTTNVNNGYDFGIVDSAVSPDGKLLIGLHSDNHFTIVALTNGIPDVSSLTIIAGTTNLDRARGIAWDAADNLYMSSSGEGLLQSWTLGRSMTAITRNDITGTNGTFQLLHGITPSINWTNPTAIIYGTALSSDQLNAAASVPGSFAYTPAAGTVLNAGTNLLTLAFTPTDTTNYNSTTSRVSLVLLPVPLTVTASNASRLYGQTNPVFNGTIIGIQNGDNLTVTYATTATTNSPAGTYPIIPALMDPNDRLVNYTVTTNNGILTVNKITPTITMLPVASAITYGQTLASSTLTGGGSSVPGNFAFTTPTTVPIAGTALQSVTFTPTDTTNYNTVTTNVSLTVNKSVPIITWNAPAAITYGTPLNSNQLNATANVPGALAYTPSAGTVLNARTNSVSVIFTPNDTVDFSSATNNVSLVVIPAPLTVTVANTNRAYGATNPPLTGTIVGLQNNDSITATYTAETTPVSVIGNYVITVTLMDPGNKLGNYTVTTNIGVLNIIPAALSVTANNATRIYGQTNPVFSGTIVGIQNSNNISANYVCIATMNSSVGVYPITPILLDPNGLLVNYSITTNNGTLTVIAAGPPIITSVSPNVGPTNGGTFVTILGSGFEINATVCFGSLPASSTSIFSSTNITALTPPLQASTVNITLTNGDGNIVVFTNGFTYLIPPVLQLAATNGNGLALSWNTVPGQTYQVQFSTSLSQASWINIGQGSAATNVTTTASESVTSNGTCFYRVTIPQGESNLLSSQNIVGYVRLSLSPGLSLIANPLDLDGNGTNNTLQTAFANVVLPNFCAIYPYPNASGDISKACYYYNGLWYPNQPFNPGDGGFFFNNATTNLNVVFTGQALQGLFTNKVPAGISVLSSPAPISGPIDFLLGLTNNENLNTIFTFNATNQSFDKLSYFYNGSWHPEIYLGIGHAFYLRSSIANIWIINSVNH